MSCRECSSIQRTARVVLPITVLTLLVACGGDSTESERGSEAVEREEMIVVRPLTSEASDEEIVNHLLAIEASGVMSVELSRHFPDLTRERAYELQRMRLERKQVNDGQVGWKIGYSRQIDPRVSIDPVFGRILASNVYQRGQSVPTNRFVNVPVSASSSGQSSEKDLQALVEAEVGIWLNQDLPGPTVNRDDVIGAVSQVGAVIELVHSRVRPDGEGPNTHNHAIADNVFHIGLMFGEKRAYAGEMDWPTERVRVEINGETQSEGRTSSIMGRDPIEGVVWLANELLKYGYQLRAGEFVITGNLVTPPVIGLGDSAKIDFTTLGALELMVGEGDG